MPKQKTLTLGFQIEVDAHPRSKKPRLEMKEPGLFDVYVAEPAEHGKANEAIERVLAKHFQVSKSGVSLIKGHKSKHKRYWVAFDNSKQE